jgi:flagellar operon protein
VVSSIRSAAAQAVPSPQKVGRTKDFSSEFGRILQDRLDSRRIALSAHAADRMMRRGVQINEGTADQLHSAFELASQKGARQALILLDEMAVIASVPDRTVKTAMDREALGTGVFTQIDTAVVMTGKTQTENTINQSHNHSTGSNGWAPTREAAIQPGGLPL